jgi:HK97 family phage major capsid protein
VLLVHRFFEGLAMPVNRTKRPTRRHDLGAEPTTLKELREKTAKLAADIQSLADHSDKAARSTDGAIKWSAEDEQKWTRVNAEYDATAEQIQKQERAWRVSREMVGEPSSRHFGIGRDDISLDQRAEADRDRAGSDRDHAAVLRAWCSVAAGRQVCSRDREACRNLGLSPTKRRLEIVLRTGPDVAAAQQAYRNLNQHRSRSAARELLEQRSMSPIFAETGGALMPQTFVNNLESAMLDFSGMLQVAEIIRTEDGGELKWPTADDTSNEGEIVGASRSVDGSADPHFGQATWGAHKFSSKMIKVPYELIEDSAFDLGARLGQLLGERLGRIQNRHYTTGTGAAGPRGVLTAARLGVTAASATAIAPDELFDLEAAMDPAHRADARFMAHSSVVSHLRKKKDANENYIWVPGLKDGVADSLIGYPLTYNQHMPSTVASGNKTLLFGRLSAYKVRQVRSVRLRRLVERYADTDEIAFVAFARADGNLLDAGDHPVKYLQH